jgi:small subunit ribosomal protein S13
MPRIAGIDVPANKIVWCALTYIHGIGRRSSLDICKEAQVNADARMKDLTDDEVARIAAIIDRNYVVEGALRRQVLQNIARLRDIACYRGVRHRRGLPVRGQRTRTNARTRKGPRKTVAGKKGVKELH